MESKAPRRQNNRGMEQMEKKIYKNGSLILRDSVAQGMAVLTHGGEIYAIVPENTPVSEDYRVVDLGGQYLAPGFVELHTHGAGGADFMDADPESFLTAARVHALHGTTALCPTTLSGEFDETMRVFAAYAEAKKRNICGARFIGLHLEGPYFAMSQKGAQDPQYIRPPVRAEYERFLDARGDIVRWSAAPELPGAMAFGRDLADRGILPSIAHTDADFDTAAEALANGYTHVTHLYSCMSGVHRVNAYRVAGAVEAALYYDGFTVEIIADGCHLPASLLKFIYKCKGAERIALVTDSMRGAGMPAGESILGSKTRGMAVSIHDGVAWLPSGDAFAGSVATMDRLVRNMVTLADVPLYEAVKMASATPAKIIGQRKKGILAPGMDADMVVLDQTLHVTDTIIGGDSIR